MHLFHPMGETQAAPMRFPDRWPEICRIRRLLVATVVVVVEVVAAVVVVAAAASAGAGVAVGAGVGGVGGSGSQSWSSTSITRRQHSQQCFLKAKCSSPPVHRKGLNDKQFPAEPEVQASALYRRRCRRFLCDFTPRWPPNAWCRTLTRLSKWLMGSD